MGGGSPWVLHRDGAYSGIKLWYSQRRLEARVFRVVLGGTSTVLTGTLTLRNTVILPKFMWICVGFTISFMKNSYTIILALFGLPLPVK